MTLKDKKFAKFFCNENNNSSSGPKRESLSKRDLRVEKKVKEFDKASDKHYSISILIKLIVLSAYSLET